MNKENVPLQIAFCFSGQDDTPWSGESKRTSKSLHPSAAVDHANYPSPPMSSRPSPLRELPQLSRSELVNSVPEVPMASTTATPFTSAYSFTLPPPPAFGPSSYRPQIQYQTTYTAPHGTYQDSRGGYGGTQGGHSSSFAVVGTNSAVPSAAPSLGRPARKSKAHVASACINCKRAHLSCDVQRPCTRCVASNKQVSLPTRRDVFDYQLTKPRTRATMFSTRNVAVQGFEKRASSRSNRWFGARSQGPPCSHISNHHLLDRLLALSIVEPTLCAL